MIKKILTYSLIIIFAFSCSDSVTGPAEINFVDSPLLPLLDGSVREYGYKLESKSKASSAGPCYYSSRFGHY